MIKYLAQRIIEGALTYNYIILKRPDLKESLDHYLIEIGKDNLITNNK